MYRLINDKNQIFIPYVYSNENEYEKMIVSNVDSIFGVDGIYFDIKKKIGKLKEGAAIPDGYYLDLKFHENPQLYFVEIERSNHDVYGHIGEQLLRFAISSDMSRNTIKKLLLEQISADNEKKKRIDNFLEKSKYSNVNALMDGVTVDKDIAIIVVIDSIEDQLTRVLSKLNIDTDIIEVQTFICNNEKIHRFTPFQEDVVEELSVISDVDEIDTIVVPAREDGFQEVFLGENCWYAIRISTAMLSRIKYIAAYRVAPISAITHYAEISTIEKYKDTDKYILYFKNTAREINHVKLDSTGKGKAPQSPRYTSFDKIKNTKNLTDVLVNNKK